MTIAGVRVDILVPITLGILTHLININQLITKLSEYLDGKCLTEKMINAGFLKTGSELRALKSMDELVTSDSVILEEK